MEQVTNAILAASSLHSKITGKPENESFIRQIKNWGAGIFRLVIMGEIKKGKSSFINALLGEKDLVPVSSDVATSTVFKIRYGSVRGYRVYFTAQSGKKPYEIAAEELELYGTEKGNPSNEKNVDFIEVIHPSPILRSGMVIIDTPGLGGLFKEHKKITWQYVPKADAVFFITDSVESPIGAEEITHLSEVRKITKHLYFVQTKASLVSDEAAQNRRANNLNILSHFFGTAPGKIPYFVTDAELKFVASEEKCSELLQLSGYPALLSFLQGSLLNKQKQILADRAIRYAAPMLEDIAQNLEERRMALTSGSQEEQKEIESSLSEAERELIQWQQTTLPQLNKQMSRGLQAIRIECTTTLARLRPHGEIHMQFENLVEQLQDMKELKVFLNRLDTLLPESASRCLLEIQKIIESRISELLEKISFETQQGVSTEEYELSKEVPASSLINTCGIQRLANRMNSANRHDAMYEKSKVVLAGGSGGIMIASVMGGLVGSFIPVVGTIAGSWVGIAIAGLWGASTASRIATQRELKAIKDETRGALSQAITSMYSSISVELEQLLVSYQNNFSDTLEDAIQQRTNALKKRRQELKERSSMNAEQLKQALLELKHHESSLSGILKILEPWISSKATA